MLALELQHELERFSFVLLEAVTLVLVKVLMMLMSIQLVVRH